MGCSSTFTPASNSRNRDREAAQDPTRPHCLSRCHWDPPFELVRRLDPGDRSKSSVRSKVGNVLRQVATREDAEASRTSGKSVDVSRNEFQPVDAVARQLEDDEGPWLVAAPDPPAY